MKQAGHNISSGLDILFYGNIPHNTGLSSSASIEVVTGTLLQKLFNLTIDRVTLSQLGQQVENKYIGVNSGIMDQFSIALGKKNKAILLNSMTLHYTYAPVYLQLEEILIIHSNKHRSLVNSEYNKQYAECHATLHDLRSKLSISCLEDLTIEQFEEYQHFIKDDINRKRAKHVVYENAHTLQALEKLQKRDLNSFGKLMNNSHSSLQLDYEVTGKELDTIVHTAWEQTGVIGARMTGAGFGGCAIAIVETKYVKKIMAQINRIYKEKKGYEVTFYKANISDGAREIKEGEYE